MAAIFLGCSALLGTFSTQFVAIRRKPKLGTQLSPNLQHVVNSLHSFPHRLQVHWWTQPLWRKIAFAPTADLTICGTLVGLSHPVLDIDERLLELLRKVLRHAAHFACGVNAAPLP